MITQLKCFNSFFLFLFLLPSSFIIIYLLPPEEDNYLSKAHVIVLHCLFVFRHIGEYISLDLFYLLILFTIILFHRNADVYVHH